MSYLSLAISAILVSNIVLERFLGICPFLGTSQKRSQAIGMGLALIAVIFISSIVTYLVYFYILIPFDIEYLQIVSFILIIASLVQFSEVFIKRFLPKLHKEFGIYLPLITTNCVVLGTVLNNIILSGTIDNFNIMHVVIYSLSVPIGYLLVIFLFSSIRERLEHSPVPRYFKGVPIGLISAALMSLAFAGFVGLLV